VGAERVTQV
jgi:hypothetical protein